MLISQTTFNLESTITDDWNGSHRIAIDLEALADTGDWQIEIALPDGDRIDQIYGAKLQKKDGKTYISGEDWNENLDRGEQTEIILIIKNTKDNPSDPLLPEFIFADSEDSSAEAIGDLPGDDFVLQSSNVSASLSLDSEIVEDWHGGYKLVGEIQAESDVADWQIDFSFPYKIRAVYGVDLKDSGDGNYTISGRDGWVNLSAGQSATPIFIIDDFGQPAVPIQSTFSTTQNTDLLPSEPVNLERDIPKAASSDDGVARTEGNGKIIDVDASFGGNLERAVAAANTGDVILLGNKTYYTDGLTIDKDITIDGKKNSVINGKGTGEAIISLTSNATGATIQDVEITNGSIGIYGYKVFDLTLDNLNLNNIGIDRPVRNGQYNTGIVLNGADGLQLKNSTFSNIGRKAVGINRTDGATISGISVQNVNLDAQHAQSHDAAGIKFFNTNDVLLKDSYFADINANVIWNDTTNKTSIVGNVVENVGEDFLKPGFNPNVNIAGIYNEKSSNSVVKNNTITAVDDFIAYKATTFTTETMQTSNNNFSSTEINTQDYWVNESIEKRIALTEDPDAADFSLFEDEYFAQADIGI